MKTRRQFIKEAAAGIGALSIGTVAGCSAKQSRPNIVLIMVDDMGFSDLGCYGSEIPTKNIDKLADEGIRFTQFYNAARCCPTRASLMTGLYPHQAGMGGMVGTNRPKGPYQGYLNDECVTIAEVLRESGYNTLMSGKWHVGEEHPHWPCDRGFMKYFGLISGAANYFDYTRTKRPGIKRHMAMDNEEFHPPKENFYMTTAITENAVNFLDEYGQKDEPFFLYLAYTAPHWPLHAFPEDIALFKGKYRMGWDNLRQARYERMLEMGIIDKNWELSPRDDIAPAWDDVDDKERMDLKMAIYAAMLYRADKGVGEVMDKISQLGKTDDTLVMFLSDNGACHEAGPFGRDFWNNGIEPGGVDSYQSYGHGWSNVGNTPFRLHKHWTHEGGIATPFIATWPKVIKNHGSLNHQAGHIIDVMATCVDVSGAEYPSTFNGKNIKPCEGKSLSPIFKGNTRQNHDYLYWEHETNKAVRHGKWKLVSRDNQEWELYDLEKDRTELHNLAETESDMTNHLKQKWQEWAEKVGV